MPNALLPLGVNMPDLAGAYMQGAQYRQQMQEAEQKNALRQALQSYGPAAMQGDQNALAELSKYDPELGMNLMGKQQDMRLADQQNARSESQLEMARQQAREASAEHVAKMGQYEREKAAADLDKSLGAAINAKTPEQWDAIMGQSEEGKQFVGQFDNRQSIIGMALGVKDALTMGQPKNTEGFNTLAQRAAAAGLAPGTPAYQDFMRNGGTQRQENAPAGYKYGPTGDLEFIPGGPADPKVGARNAVPTEGERKAGGMYERMVAAEKTLDDLAAGGSQNLSLAESALNRAGVPEGYALSGESQRVLQAQRDWVRAKLRLESGAVIGDEEMREEIKTYFPQPGEDEATVAQKKQAREQAMEQVRTQGGRSVSEGEPARPRSTPQVGAVEEGYEYMGGPPDQMSSWRKVQP